MLYHLRTEGLPQAHICIILCAMDALRLILAGAAIGNGNRGVEALGRSVIDAVDRDVPGGHLDILDDGWGVRPDISGRYQRASVSYVGVRLSRRWHRPESWAQIRVAQALGSRFNAAAKAFDRANAILDLSAGDSFTDLYGPARLDVVSAPKEAALRARRPLVLLPQTYGPFNTAEGRRRAERLVRSSALAYARDTWSYERLLELAGPDADATRLREGVDVAFSLEPRRPADEVADALELIRGELTAGVNVSGLLRDEPGHTRFGLAGDYMETMTAVVRGLLDAGARVVLVPHVHLAGGQGESDIAAITLLVDRLALTPAERELVTVVPPELDAAELKWCISQLDWFVGSRMHSTIAALSTLTPTAAYAYSDKNHGVFATCALGDEVIDARKIGGAEAAQLMLDSFARRDAIGEVLRAEAPMTIERSRQQLREVMESVDRWRTEPSELEAIG